jgi:hypothetical protein
MIPLTYRPTFEAALLSLADSGFLLEQIDAPHDLKPQIPRDALLLPVLCDLECFDGSQLGAFAIDRCWSIFLQLQAVSLLGPALDEQQRRVDLRMGPQDLHCGVHIIGEPHFSVDIAQESCQQLARAIDAPVYVEARWYPRHQPVQWRTLHVSP